MEQRADQLDYKKIYFPGHVRPSQHFELSVLPARRERAACGDASGLRLPEAIHWAAKTGMDCFVAEPVIGRAFARSVGASQ
jgi:hypothetical protein